MILFKKWENRRTYKTRYGGVEVKRSGNYATVEIDNQLLANSLISLHGFNIDLTGVVSSQKAVPAKEERKIQTMSNEKPSSVITEKTSVSTEKAKKKTTKKKTTKKKKDSK